MNNKLTQKKHFLLSICIFLNLYMTAQKSPTWSDLVNLSISGNNIIKDSGANSWGSGGTSSLNVLDSNTDGWVQAIVSETNTARFLGLSSQNIDAGFTTINYGLYLRHTGELKVYENGVLKYNNVNHLYKTGDIIKIERISGTINYKINENVFYTSTTSSNSNLLVDLAFYNINGTLNNIEISDSFSESNPSTNSFWNETNNVVHPVNLNSKISVGSISVPNSYLLAVDGKAIFEEVKVQLSENWPDFVLYNSFILPSLKQVENYIKENGHLKDIPSAEEVKKNGIFLGEMDSKLLQKIEELTLYTIQQQKEIEELKLQNIKILELQLKLEKLESRK